MNNMKLPANCAIMSEEEMTYIEGGDALSIAAKTVVAVGVSVALVCVAAVAANGILGIFSPSFIEDSVNGGKNFIDNALNAGQNFLNGLLGK